MTEDDAAARKNRADDLRKQIGSLEHQQSDAGAKISPRDFIDAKMRELDEQEKQEPKP